MNREFNIGDDVCVAYHIVSYSTRKRDLYGAVGVIVAKTQNRYGVKLAGLKSSVDKDGLFWFNPNAIILREEKLKILDEFINSVDYIPLHITKVIFNNPATIVFWSDGKKTVVKCAGDEAFDEEKGLAMAISKRVLGNQGNYYNEFKKWLPKIEVPCGRKNCDGCDDFDCKNTPDSEDKGATHYADEHYNKAKRKNILRGCDTCKYSMYSAFSEQCITCNHHERWEKWEKGDK